mgnify:CR=1 FL=1
MLIELIQQIQSEVAELKKQMLFYKQRADNAEQAYDYLMQQYKNLARWYKEISNRDAVKRGFAFMNKDEFPPEP